MPLWKFWKTETESQAATAVEEPEPEFIGEVPPESAFEEERWKAESERLVRDIEESERERQEAREQRAVSRKFVEELTPEEEEDSKEDIEAAERRKRALKLTKKSTQVRLAAEMAKQRQAVRKAGESRAQRIERGAKFAGRVAGVGYKLGTLGGRPKVVRKELYVPKVREELYLPDSGARGGDLREASRPRLGKLRAAGALRAGGETGLARVTEPRTQGLISIKGQSVALGLLREMTTPKGLMPVERYAYAEIVANHDRDTVQHVVSELSAIGITRRDATAAIGSLLRKGIVRKSYDNGRAPELEVIR